MDLTTHSIAVGYGRTQICRDVSLSVPGGQMVGLIGRNGAGKTTLLRGIAGSLRPSKGAVALGSTDITSWSIPRRMRTGLVHVPQELALFPEMTVAENLALGAYLDRDRQRTARSRDLVLSVFPRLAERQQQLAGTMSGGEQRMLAIGRGLMAAPRLLLLDEPCTGLSPLMQDTLFDALREVLGQGIGILLAEQNLLRTAREANEILLLRRGELVSRRPGARDADGNLVGDARRIASELGQLELAAEVAP